MARIKVLCDSACDIPDAELAQYGIGLVSLSIRFGDEEFIDRVNLTPHDFWLRCSQSKTLPETAAPSPGAFQLAYEAAADDGYDGVVVVTLSSELSATHQSATLAAAAVRDRIDVRVVDTRAVSMAQGLIAIDVAERALTGQGLDELEAHATSLVGKVGVLAMLNTLEHLIKGGRVGGARALLGQVLSIKPLLKLADGIVTEGGRQRTTARALKTIADEARRHAPLARLALIHGESPEVGALRDLVADIDTRHPLIVADIGPTVGTHGGPGLIGLTWLEA